MASTQDLESRLGVVERKLDFVMKLAQVTKRTPSIISPGDFLMEQISLLDLYREVSTSGGEIVEVKDDGTAV
jgi:hypothetical protein